LTVVRLPLSDNVPKSDAPSVSSSEAIPEKPYTVCLPRMALRPESSRRIDTAFRPQATGPESVTTIDEFPLGSLSSESRTGASFNALSSPPSTAVDSRPIQATFQAQQPSQPHADGLPPIFERVASGGLAQPAPSDPSSPLAQRTPPYQPGMPFTPQFNYGGSPPSGVFQDGGYPSDNGVEHSAYYAPPMQLYDAVYGPPFMMHAPMRHPSEMMQYRQMPGEFIPMYQHQEPQYLQFSLPRQTRRVHIRAPGDNVNPPPPVGSPGHLRPDAEGQAYPPSSPPYTHASVNTGAIGSDGQQIASPPQENDVPGPLQYPSVGTQYYSMPPYTYGQFVDPTQYQGYGEGQPIYY